VKKAFGGQLEDLHPEPGIIILLMVSSKGVSPSVTLGSVSGEEPGVQNICNRLKIPDSGLRRKDIE
jgi:hypothetical protein